MIDAVELSKKLNSGGIAKPFWICGPCVIESRDVLAKVAETIKSISVELKVPMVFKASFDKANRTSVDSFRGLGIEEGLRELEWVSREFELPVLTDIHESTQVSAVAEVVDILQIPAFLCRQTDLIAAACKSGRAVNVKKGQFLAPTNVKEIIGKLEHFEAKAYWITERGTSFGYQRLIVDFAGFEQMKRDGAPLIMDITHSVQLPGAGNGVTSGMREAIPSLAHAAAAVGVTGFFAETHPVPAQSKSDAANAWPLDQLKGLIKKCLEIAQTAHAE